MPELPEVQTIVNDLNKEILNKKITSIKITKSRLVKGSDAKFKKVLIDNKITKVERRGKLLIFRLATTDYRLLIHLKMTGQLIYQIKDKVVAGGHPEPKADECLPCKYTHVYFTFADKSHLYFNDQRTFGYLKVVDEKELEKIKSKFGVEPLSPDFTFEKFKELLKGKNTMIKTFLLDQKHVAGIGNIYADEICWHAKVKPSRRIKTLTLKEKKELWKAIPKVLNDSIKYRGTTFSDYVDAKGKKGNYVSKLKVYGKEGEPCAHCKNVNIEKTKIKISGRGTRVCPNCQK
ncbi:bifunctional DNA-formamidopyrimidine glycosylase/DNA-(apurinic or apyrimidinic site) lyase [Patescibacteria group bacterium]|nr:bifunctional DNA-formamidopyrimidine glycosylase/DNA-(apurinic or apyrimidinic site) lyase [Patescibacteria group bacterium]MBU1672958.1 bifunctional DNA-formamidopyrimidine glycosylase/DNA-(apurinic or apyrimidinic site) lyase [Patescibacteria group bacterium]